MSDGVEEARKRAISLESNAELAAETAIKLPLEPLPKPPASLCLPQLPAAVLAGRRPPARPLASAADDVELQSIPSDKHEPLLRPLEVPKVEIVVSTPSPKKIVNRVKLIPKEPSRPSDTFGSNPTLSAHPKSLIIPEVSADKALAGKRLKEIFGIAGSSVIDRFVRGCTSEQVLKAFADLAEQAIKMGIDYRALGLGWDHPTTRAQYRKAQHPSTLSPASRQRAAQSQANMIDAMSKVANGEMVGEDAARKLFLSEIGVQVDSELDGVATFEGVAAALRAELLLPLRAFNDGQRFMHHTYSGEPVPPNLIAELVRTIVSAVLSSPSGFAAWRYSNPVGLRQLEGLTTRQVKLWKEPTSINHACGLRTHEDDDSELGFFWATKIGGPSHGFDFEAQCLLPLLSNARHKVVLVSDPAYPLHPCGRAHWRLLWTASKDGTPAPLPEPRLWLETVNIDFDAARVVDASLYVPVVLHHIVAKAEEMEVPVLIDVKLTDQTNQIAHKFGAGGRVYHTQERLMLYPSNGVTEASDFLSRRHDWVQLQPEVTMPLYRALYVPSALSDIFAGRAKTSAATAGRTT